MSLFAQISLFLISYVTGSIPFGYLLTRYNTGLNIMEYGSGNIGSTNVRRIAGAKIGFYVQLLDMLKGFIPVLLFSLVKSDFPDNFIYLIALGTILGHNFSVFLNFKGGKGVNTTLGSSVLFAPLEVSLAVLIYLMIKHVFHYVSLGSIAIGITLPLAAYMHEGMNARFLFLFLCSVMILIRHQQNIRRLFSNTEFR
jgi:glycerol-3-phosphate acyltransferase PlsY